MPMSAIFCRNGGEMLFYMCYVWSMEHEERRKNGKYKTIANRLIRTREDLADLREADFTFCVLSSDKEQKSNRKLVLGQCELVPDKYRWAIPYDFTITIFEPNIMTLDEKQLEILILHELKHIGIDTSGDEPKNYIVPHDYEEFRSIIDEFGLDWAGDM